jgi:DNA-binding LacI/PurR family transcriptional regulator
LGSPGNRQNLSRFSVAFEKTKATAWVCQEDKTALGAVSFLRSHGIRVPEDISVVGFENWREAYEQHLTTYDFNMAGMVRQALLMILDENLFQNKPAISEVDGYVVERRTTRK